MANAARSVHSLRPHGGAIAEWFASEDVAIPTERIRLCDKASEESVYLRDTLYWPAHTTLIARGMYDSVQESLLTGKPDVIKSMFDAVKLAPEGFRKELADQLGLLGRVVSSKPPAGWRPPGVVLTDEDRELLDLRAGFVACQYRRWGTFGTYRHEGPGRLV